MANILDVIAGGISGLAKDAAAGIFEGVAKAIGSVVGDPTVKAQLTEKLAEAQIAAGIRIEEIALQGIQAQTRINEIEAASPDNFTRRWRPFIGWTCGVGLASALIVGPFFTWAAGWIATGKPGPFPTIDTNLLWMTLGSMLGIGTMRTVEKVQGVTK